MPGRYAQRAKVRAPQADNNRLEDSSSATTLPLTLAGVGSVEGSAITDLEASANRLLWYSSRCRFRDTESC